MAALRFLATGTVLLVGAVEPIADARWLLAVVLLMVTGHSLLSIVSGHRFARGHIAA